MTSDQQFILALIPAVTAAIASVIAALKGMQNGRKLDDHATQLSDIQTTVSTPPSGGTNA